MPRDDTDPRVGAATQPQEEIERREFLKTAAKAAATAPAVALLLSAESTHAQAWTGYKKEEDPKPIDVPR